MTSPVQPVKKSFHINTLPKLVIQQLGGEPKRDSGIRKMLTESTAKAIATYFDLDKQPFELLHHTVRFVLQGKTSEWEPATSFAFVDKVRAHFASWDTFSEDSITSYLIIDEIQKSVQLLRSVPCAEILCFILTRTERRYCLISAISALGVTPATLKHKQNLRTQLDTLEQLVHTRYNSVITQIHQFQTLETETVSSLTSCGWAFHTSYVDQEQNSKSALKAQILKQDTLTTSRFDVFAFASQLLHGSAVPPSFFASRFK